MRVPPLPPPRPPPHLCSRPHRARPPPLPATQEIEEFCRAASGGATEADPFEGLTPQEIDEYIEKHGLPGGAQL